MLLGELLEASEHVERLLSARTAEQAVELAAELFLATSGASGVAVFVPNAGALEEQWAVGVLAGRRSERQDVAAQVVEKGEVRFAKGLYGLPLSTGRVAAVLVAQGGPGVTREYAELLATICSKAVEAAALRTTVSKQQQSLLLTNRFLQPSVVHAVTGADRSALLARKLRQVSILAVHVDGFSHQVDVVGPERMAVIIHQYFAALADAVFEREGLLVEHGLDGATAVFGAPIPSSETTAADLAVDAAFSLLERVEAIAERWGMTGFPVHIECRAGVVSGPALVGAFGPPDRPLLAALGPQVALAAKLALQGEGEEVVVDSTTRTLLAERLSTRSVGAVEVPGLDYPVFAYAARPLD